MRPNPPTGTGPTAPPAPLPTPAPPARFRRRRPIAVATLCVAAGAVWWWGRTPPTEPPTPAEINDPEVRAAVEEARGQVLADPRSAAAWGHLGLVLQTHSFGGEADRCFAEATRLDPGNGAWPYYRALNAQREDPDRALPFLREAAAAEGPMPGDHRAAVRLRLAEVLLERRETAEAERLFRAEWDARPGDPRAGFGLGLAALARGDTAAAETYRTAARASPVVRTAAAAQLATLARDRGDAAAATAFEKEVAAAPGEAPVWPDPLVAEVTRLRVGAYKAMQDTTQLEAQHRYADAAKAYLQKVGRSPTAENYVGAGLNLVRSGNAPAGLKLLQTGIDLNPNRCESHYGLALAQFQLAAQERERAPGSRAAGERFRAAAAAARRATELKPDYAEAFLLWGGALVGGGDPAAALAPLRQGVACRPELFHLQLALGDALVRVGRLDEAEVHLGNAAKLDPKNEQLGPTLERLRDRQK
jgi:tetratricopeptide (TPR) repeat protein